MALKEKSGNNLDYYWVGNTVCIMGHKRQIQSFGGIAGAELEEKCKDQIYDDRRFVIESVSEHSIDNLYSSACTNTAHADL
jgi:hypothetical protein